MNKKSIPSSIYMFFYRLESKRLGIKNLKIERRSDLFILSEEEEAKVVQWSFPNNLRFLGGRYSDGLTARGHYLAKDYRVDTIKLQSSDIIIDCGANFGDLWLYLNSLELNLKYYGIEPGIDEFKVLKNNIEINKTSTLVEASLYSNALGDSNGKKTFYYSPERGDSSLIMPLNYINTYEVDVLTIDSFVQGTGLSNQTIKLLKLEAEGFEPEILYGSINTLKNIEYIAADLSPERGVNEDNTIAEVTSFLTRNNFEMILFNNHVPPYRLSALYKNRLFI
ncbi:FkbM family methyltransferase [Prochlorococcus sp. MIT 1341]|uniref:FkbM family methyltransferase n=1 Tax=Prochlorococcus sp. MIT 1341 TaxID=3096221 RepID=UPI002A75B63C|nr:FkbM family methyltransferase [Prochlorococcus sp. MIT 1341]